MLRGLDWLTIVNMHIYKYKDYIYLLLLTVYLLIRVYYQITDHHGNEHYQLLSLYISVV